MLAFLMPAGSAPTALPSPKPTEPSRYALAVAVSDVNENGYIRPGAVVGLFPFGQAPPSSAPQDCKDSYVHARESVEFRDWLVLCFYAVENIPKAAR